MNPSRCKIKLMAGQFHMLIEIRFFVLSSWEGTDVYLDPIGIGGYSQQWSWRGKDLLPLPQTDSSCLSGEPIHRELVLTLYGQGV